MTWKLLLILWFVAGMVGERQPVEPRPPRRRLYAVTPAPTPRPPRRVIHMATPTPPPAPVGRSGR